jgi:hypothetical protein
MLSQLKFLIKSNKFLFYFILFFFNSKYFKNPNKWHPSGAIMSIQVLINPTGHATKPATHRCDDRNRLLQYYCLLHVPRRRVPLRVYIVHSPSF